MGDLSDQLLGGSPTPGPTPSSTPTPNVAPGLTLPGEGVAGVTPTDSGLSDFLVNGGTDAAASAKLATSMRFGQDIAPERAARVLKQVAATGLPADYLTRSDNLEKTEADSAAADFDPDAYRRTNPAVAAWLSEHPVNAAVAHGDLDNLGMIESTVRAIGSGFVQGADQTQIGHLGFDQLNNQSDPTTAATIASLQNEIAAQPEGHGFLGFLQSLSRLGGSLYQSAKTGLKVAAVTAPLGAAAGSVIPGPGTIAGGVTGGLEGFGVGFLGDMMRSMSGQTYLDLGHLTDANGQTMSEGTRRAAALSIGLISGTLMTVGGVAMKNTMAAGLRTVLTKQLATDVAQPSIAQALSRFGTAYVHTMAEQGGIGAGLGLVNALGTQAAELASHQNFDQSAGSVTTDALHQMISGAADMLEQMAVPSLIGPGAAFMHDRESLQRAQVNANLFQSLGTGIKDSKTYQHLPSAIQDMVGRMTANGPIENLYIPTDKWNTYWQSQSTDPAAIAAKVTGSDTAYQEAMQSGGDLKVPTSRYAANIAGTDHHAYFAQEVRLGSPDQPNGREADEYQKQLEQSAETDTAPGAEPAAKSAQQVIQEDLSEQAKGKLPPRQITANAHMTANLYVKMAEREGIDPLQLYKEEPFLIRRDENPMAGTNEAATPASPDAPGETGPALEQQVGRLQPKDQSLAFESLLKQSRKANGDRTPVEGSQEWNDLVEESKQIDSDRGVTYHQADETTPAPKPRMVHDAIRGFIRSLTGGGHSVHFTDQANESTWMHEAAHAFLNIMGRMAQRDGATQQLRDDYQKALEYSGYGTHENKLAQEQELGDLQKKISIENRAPTADEKKRLTELAAPHEKWARSWEAYLREGKSPSPALRRIFYMMAGWLTRLYKSVSMLDVDLTPEIRGVMDRLVASEQEIADAKHASSSAQDLFATPEAMGVNPEEFHAYRMGKQKELVSARDQFTRELAEEIKAQESERREQETNEVHDEKETEVSNRPVYQAIRALQSGKAPDGTELEDNPKLNRDGILSVMDQEGEGKPFLKKLPRGVYRVNEGSHPDSLAQRFGYDSGREMLTAMASAPNREAQIDAETKAEMEKRYPTPFEDGTAEKMAQDAVQNSERGHVLHMELKALSKLARESKMARFQAAAEEKTKGKLAVEEEKAHGREMVANEKARGDERLEKKDAQISEIRQAGQDDAATQRAVVDRVPDREFFKDAATKVLSTKAIKDINPKDYLATARRSSEAAFQAFAKRNYAEAAVAKSRELLNHELYREGSKMVTDADKAAKYMRRFDRPDVRARIAKGGKDYLDQIDRLTAAYGFRKLTNKAMAKLESLRAFIDRIQKQADTNGEEIPLPSHLLDRANEINYRELPHSDIMSLRDSVQMLEHTALWKNKMMATREALRIEDIKGQLVEAARTNLVKRPPRPYTKAGYTWYESVKHAFALGDAELMKMEQLVEWLDGGDLAGPWHQYFWDGASTAQNHEYDLAEQVTHKIAHSVENIPKEISTKMLERVKIIATDNDGKPIDRALTRRDLLSVALNYGNEGNASKLMKGHGWNYGQLAEMLSHVSTQEMDFAQGVWDTLETLRPEIAKLQKELTGLEPEWVEARPFTHNGKEYRGGYYPVMYDPKDPKMKKELELSSDVGQMVEAQYARATTPKGYLKERTEGAYEILLDHSALTARVAGVIKDLTHRKWLMDANKIVSDPAIRSALQETLGDGYDQHFKSWVSQVVNDRNNPNSSKMSALDGWLEKVRVNVLVATEGFKFSTMLSEWSGINQAIEAVGRGDADGHKWMLPAYAETMRDMKGTYDFVTAKSGEYRHRIETRNRDYRSMLERLEGKTGPIAKLQHLSLHVLGYAEMAVSLPTWVAGYRKALAQGYDDAVAVRAGDMAVRMSHGSGAPKDLAPIMARKNSMWRALTMFYSTFSGMYNRCRDIQKAAGDASRLPSIEQPKAFAKVAMRTWWIWVVGGALGEVMHGHTGPNKQQNETWGGWLTRKVGLFPLQSIPLMRDLTPATEQLLEGKKLDSYNPTPLTEPVTDVMKMITAWEGHDYQKAIEQSIKAAGTVGGLPTSQAAVTIHGLTQMLHGDGDMGQAFHDIFLHHEGK